MTRKSHSKIGCCGGSPHGISIPADSDAVRSQVRQAYANAITLTAEPGGTSCCAPSGGGGAAAQIAGYPSNEATLFAQAADSSFGCGNPLAFAENLAMTFRKTMLGRDSVPGHTVNE